MIPFAPILFPYRRRMYPYGIRRVTRPVPENRNSLWLVGLAIVAVPS